MKRFIYVPAEMLGKDNELPLEAVALAYTTKLQVRTGEISGPFYGNLNLLSVIRIPERRELDCRSHVLRGLIAPIDYTNEFTYFNNSLVCKVFLSDGKVDSCKPTILEKHVAKFRYRTNISGLHKFAIELEGEIIESGKFEVI